MTSISTKQFQTYHKGITCNHCKIHNFSGERFKCTVCENYNLCGSCMRKFHVDPYIHSLEHIFFIIPLISFDPGALRPDVKFTGTKVICAKHKENSTNPVSGKCCVCKSELVDGQYKYCDTCSLRYYVCILCGVGAT